MLGRVRADRWKARLQRREKTQMGSLLYDLKPESLLNKGCRDKRPLALAIVRAIYKSLSLSLAYQAASYKICVTEKGKTTSSYL
jgi:hypothetical protein